MKKPARMTARKDEVIRFFGGSNKTARAFGITNCAVSLWPELIPERRALQLPVITGGQLQPFPMEEQDKHSVDPIH
jgi:hypothetical protein